MDNEKQSNLERIAEVVAKINAEKNFEEIPYFDKEDESTESFA